MRRHGKRYTATETLTEIQVKFKSGEWCVLGPSVWIHTSGMRLHKGGAISIPSQLCKGKDDGVRYLKLPDYTRLDRLEVLWGNKRRGLMAFAVEILAEKSIT